MFHNKRQFTPPCGNTLLRNQFEERSVSEDGTESVALIEKYVDAESVPPLPRPENFSIEAYKRSGIPLEQVNTKLLTPNLSSADIESIAERVFNKMENKSEE